MRTPEDTPLVEIEWTDAEAHDEDTRLTVSKSTRAWNESQAEALLDRLHDEAAAAAHPFSVSATHPDTGLTLAITVGAPRSLVTFHEGADHAWSAAGDAVEPPPGEPAFVFHFAGEYTEAPWEATVTAAAARQAFMEFFRSGERPVSLDWEQDY